MKNAILNELSKNSEYNKEISKDRYTKYGLVAFFGGWPGVTAYYLWRRREQLRRDLQNTSNKEKITKIKGYLKEINKKLMNEKIKFQRKLSKKVGRLRNRNEDK